MKPIQISLHFNLWKSKKMSKYKLVLSTILVTLTLVSCKTIQIVESSVFKEGKYNYDRVVRRLKKTDYSESRKDSLLKAYNTIINTNEELISTTEKVSVWRKFLKQDTLHLEYFVFEPQKTEKVGLFLLAILQVLPILLTN